MTKKITISVPDKLHEKMMEWKDSFNFSQVFQNAISDLIQKKEDFQKRLKGDEKMTEIVERLKREKEESEHEWFEQGKTDGLEFAKNIDYETLKYALNWKPMKELPGIIFDYDPTKDEYLGEQFSIAFDEYDQFNFEENIPNDFYIEWEAGWKEGVIEFWNEIKDKI